MKPTLEFRWFHKLDDTTVLQQKWCGRTLVPPLEVDEDGNPIYPLNADGVPDKEAMCPCTEQWIDVPTVEEEA